MIGYLNMFNPKSTSKDVYQSAQVKCLMLMLFITQCFGVYKHEHEDYHVEQSLSIWGVNQKDILNRQKLIRASAAVTLAKAKRSPASERSWGEPKAPLGSMEDDEVAGWCFNQKDERSCQIGMFCWWPQGLRFDL